jgi:hypothetical protein
MDTAHGRRGIDAATWSMVVIGIMLLALQSQRAERTPDERSYQISGRVLLERQGLHAVEQRFQGPLIYLGTQLTDDHAIDVRTPASLHRARLGMLVFPAVLLAVLVAWSRSAFGPVAGLWTAFLAATNPTLLAYAPLVSSDVAFTAMGTAAAFAAFAWLQQPSLLRLLGFGSALGALAATKYTSAITGGGIAFAVLAATCSGFDPAARAASEAPPRGLGRRIALAMLALVAAAMLALGMLYAAYLFASPPFGAQRSATLESTALKAIAALPLGSTLLGILPEPLVAGLDYQAVVTAQTGNGSFGEQRGNHPAYYPVSIAFKTPLVLLLLALLGAITARSTKRWFWLCAGLPPLLLLAYCSGTKALQMGIRYVLPIVPLLLLLAGAALARPWTRTRLGRIVLVGVVGSSLWNVAACWQHPIGFFNLLAGGAANGFRIVPDSNCDWWQRLTPDEAALRARHADVQFLRPGQGPRFGTVAIYYEHLVASDAREPQRIHHWLRRFTPIDHDSAAWLVFDATPAAFERAIAAGDRRAAEELAVAWLLQNDVESARRALSLAGGDDGDPDRKALAERVERFAAAGEDRHRRDAEAAAWAGAGYPELALALLDRDQRHNAKMAFWLLTQTGEPLAAIAHLESKTADGSRTTEEVVLLAASLVDGGNHYPPDPMRAAALMQSGPAPAADSPWQEPWQQLTQRVTAAIERERRFAQFR